MMREGVPIGVFSVWRTEVHPFTDKQIELVTTFADQGAIAIENVRLFQELEARNRDLTAILEQQTATAEVLRVIAEAQTDAQPVFDTIAANALRDSTSLHACPGVFRFDGETDPRGRAPERQSREGTNPSAKRTYRHRAAATLHGARDPDAGMSSMPSDVREVPEYQLPGHGGRPCGIFRSVLVVPDAPRREPDRRDLRDGGTGTLPPSRTIRSSCSRRSRTRP